MMITKFLYGVTREIKKKQDLLPHAARDLATVTCWVKGRGSKTKNTAYHSSGWPISEPKDFIRPRQ